MQEALKRYSLREKAGADPQTYALGLKEVWQVGSGFGRVEQQGPDQAELHSPWCTPWLPFSQIDPAKHEPGTVWHTLGSPLPWNTYGGGWLYHMADNRVSLGCAVPVGGCVGTLPASILVMAVKLRP